MLKDQKEVAPYREYAKDQKIYDKIRENVTLDKQQITLEEFSKLAQ
jgi:hypothetical protein